MTLGVREWLTRLWSSFSLPSRKVGLETIAADGPHFAQFLFNSGASPQAAVSGIAEAGVRPRRFGR
jgi:hypothetical protein